MVLPAESAAMALQLLPLLLPNNVVNAASLPSGSRRVTTHCQFAFGAGGDMPRIAALPAGSAAMPVTETTVRTGTDQSGFRPLSNAAAKPSREPFLAAT